MGRSRVWGRVDFATYAESVEEVMSHGALDQHHYSAMASPFPALLARAPVYLQSDERPILRAVFGHQLL